MRFALLGDHPDGLDMARALVESGRHELVAYSGSPVGAEYLRRWQVRARPVGDLEEVLADPAVTAVIVAGSPADRPAQLRRALQAERDVLCVHPADQTPDAAYEAAMLQEDTRCLALPLLPEALHPAVRRLAWLARAAGPARLVEMERWSAEPLLLDHDTPGHRPGVPGWDVLRLLGGEVVEVLAYSGPQEVEPEEPLLLAGRFASGALFRAAFLPSHHESRWRLAVLTRFDRLELVFPEGWPGPCRLTYRDERGAEREETWDAWNPWPALVEAFEESLSRQPAPHPAAGAARPAGAHAVAAGPPPVPAAPRPLAVGGGASVAVGPPSGAPETNGEATLPDLTWQDAVRCLELDDAARRSVHRRRASTLEYQEASEEASFKGTMTLVGCAAIWGSLALLILSRWLPWLGWVILPALGVFLGLQLLRWVVPTRPPTGEEPKG
jgi:predicted dehydrogenase